MTWDTILVSLKVGNGNNQYRQDNPTNDEKPKRDGSAESIYIDENPRDPKDIPDAYGDRTMWYTEPGGIDLIAEQYGLVPGEFTTEHNVQYAYLQENLSIDQASPPTDLSAVPTVTLPDGTEAVAQMTKADFEMTAEPVGVYLFPIDSGANNPLPGQIGYRVDVRGLPLGIDPGRALPSQGEIGFVVPQPIPLDRVEIYRVPEDAKSFLRVLAALKIGNGNNQYVHDNPTKDDAVELPTTVSQVMTVLELGFNDYSEKSKMVGGIGSNPLEQQQFVVSIAFNAGAEDVPPDALKRIQSEVTEFTKTPELQALFERYGEPQFIPAENNAKDGSREAVVDGLMASNVGGNMIVYDSPLAGRLPDPELAPQPGTQTWMDDQSILRHEYGHYVGNLLMDPGRAPVTGLEFPMEAISGNELTTRWEDLWSSVPRTVPDWGTQLSGLYSGSSPQEGFADAFSIVTSEHYSEYVRATYPPESRDMLDFAAEVAGRKL